MGNTYSVPRSVKGESRLLVIFTVRSFIYTVVSAILGLVVYFIFSLVGLKTVGLVIIVIFSLIGYAMGSLTIPDSPIMGILRKAGGEKLGDIIFRTITFKKRKKIYIYDKGGKI